MLTAHMVRVCIQVCMCMHSCEAHPVVYYICPNMVLHQCTSILNVHFCGFTWSVLKTVAKLHDHVVEGGQYLSSKKGKDATASTNIHHNFPLKVSCVLQDCSVIGSGPDLILQHVLLMHEHAIVMEVQLSTACICFGRKLILLLLQ